ncbi:MAG: hypothetical protein KDF95_19435, partial [Rhodocyclaceae bacterium]|nr:hypothetical protein [Rhodocyclaceae bacterium]
MPPRVAGVTWDDFADRSCRVRRSFDRIVPGTGIGREAGVVLMHGAFDARAREMALCVSLSA